MRTYNITYSVSIKVEHCGLALKGRAIKLLLVGLFTELKAGVDSRGLALEDCEVILP